MSFLKKIIPFIILVFSACGYAKDSVDHSADDLRLLCDPMQNMIEEKAFKDSMRWNEFHFDGEHSITYPNINFAEACKKTIESGGGLQKVRLLIDQFKMTCARRVDELNPGYVSNTCETKAVQLRSFTNGFETLSKSERCNFTYGNEAVSEGSHEKKDLSNSGGAVR